MSEQDIDNYEEQLNRDIADLQQQKTANALSSAAQTMPADKNIIEFQLDTSNMLEKLERFYKGEYEGVDEKNRPTWKVPEDKELVTFNEFGVSSMMEIVTKYIDKNTLLSTYSEERIMEILADIGEELVLFLLCNYEKVGLDTYFKKTKFRLVITTTLHIIESSYRRALRGQTRIDLNQNKIVTQTDLIGNRGVGGQRPNKSRWDPRNWI